MTDIHRTPIEGPSVWSAADLRDNDDWIHRLDPAEIRDIEAALAAARDAGRDGTGIGREDFPLPHLSAAIARWTHEIEDGRGFLLVRGFPVADAADIDAMFWGLGRHLGEAIVQNYEGRRINEVRSRGHSYDEVNIRAYATASHLGFHNDPSDLTCLLCVRPAKTGGISRIASAAAVYNRILQDQPEHLEPLCRGFHHDIRGEGPTGDFNETTDTAIPVYSWFAGKLSCCLNSKAIASARIKRGGTLTAAEQAALDAVEAQAAHPELRFEFMLEPGDILMMNNYSVLHARSAFEDWEEAERKRLLLRLWLNLHDGRPLAPDFTGRFNTGHRGGAVVHDHTDADLIDAGR